MFGTAFLWGMGASLGASFGVFLLVVVLSLFKRVAESKAVQKVEAWNDRVLELMTGNNEQMQLICAHLATVAEATKACEDPEGDR